MGIYLSKPRTEKVSEDGENDRLRYGLSFMQGWRSSMEDAHAAIPDLDNSTSFFAVYDGHGGKAVAKFCAKFLHKELLTDEAYLAGDLSTSLRRAFLRMDEVMNSNRKWRELLWDDIETDSGFDDELYFASGETEQEADEGLSKEAVELSRDHKPELEGEQERILKAGGFIHDGRVNGTLNLARAIGDMQFKQNKLLPAEEQIVTANPDINTIELSDDDEFIVLACDGIWDCMSSQELVDFVREQLRTETRLSVICEKVFDRCLAPAVGGEGCDNMTMILVQFKKPVTSSSAAEDQSLPSHKSSEKWLKGSHELNIGF